MGIYFHLTLAWKASHAAMKDNSSTLLTNISSISIEINAQNIEENVLFIKSSVRQFSHFHEFSIYQY